MSTLLLYFNTVYFKTAVPDFSKYLEPQTKVIHENENNCCQDNYQTQIIPWLMIFPEPQDPGVGLKK